MSVQIGLALKAAGQDQIEDHGGKFLEEMRRVARVISKANGQVTSDDLREWAKAHWVEPHHPNAWGAIFRGKCWVPIGYTKSRHASNHARVIRVWKYQPTAEDQKP